MQVLKASVTIDKTDSVYSWVIDAAGWTPATGRTQSMRDAEKAVTDQIRHMFQTNYFNHGDVMGNSSKGPNVAIKPTLNWLKALPDEMEFAQTCILSFMVARDAVDEKNSIGPEEMDQFCDYLDKVYANLRLISNMSMNKSSVRMVNGDAVETKK